MSVLGRSAQLLRAIAHADESVTLTELRAATGLPLTTVHRLVAELTVAGLVERDGGGGLQIGAAAWELGRRYERSERLRAVAGRYLRDLHEVSRSTVELCRLLHGELVVVEKLTLESQVPWDGRIERLSFTTTAPGIAILAASRPDVLSHYLAHARSDRLATTLRDTRAVGAARLAGPAGVVVAAAFLGRDGPEGAVAVTAPDEGSARSLVPSVLVTARRIAVALARP